MTPTLAVGIGVLLLLSADRRLTPASFLLLSLFPTMWGFQELCAQRGFPADAWVVSGILIAVSLGALTHRMIRGTCNPSDEQVLALDPRGLAYTTAAVGILSITHFAVVGVPAFSGGAETERFSLGSSGLFGLPSRALLFGVPILALITAVHRERVSVQVFRTTWAIFVVSRLLMGFKGGLLEVGIIAITAALVRARPLRLKTLVLSSLAGGAALSYASWIGGHYQTIARTGGVTSSYLLDRLTVGSASPAWYAMTLGGQSAVDEPVYIHDLHYFLLKYFHLGSGRSYAWDQIVSSFVTGTPRTGDAFLVPVTTGGPAYLIGSFPPAVSLTTAFSLGFALALSCRSLRNGRGYPAAVSSAAFLVGARMFMLNGAGVYLAINFSFTLLVLVIVYFAPATASHVRSRRSRPANPLAQGPSRAHERIH